MATMIYVSLIFEFLLSRPRVVFWFAALTQAVLWIVVPSLFYAAPPGNLPLAIAVGHEGQLGSFLGPPLAHWLAEIAFVASGNSVVGIYILSQICVLLALWFLFELGRAMVGVAHAVLAVLLMAGMAALSVPTPEFGPAILALPLWTLALLLIWRAITQDEPRVWLGLGLVLGLLMLGSWLGMVFFSFAVLLIGVTRHGRAAARRPGPWAALAVAFVVSAPWFAWLAGGGRDLLPAFDIRLLGRPGAMALAFGHQVLPLLLACVGVLVLTALASGARVPKGESGAAIERQPAPSFATTLILLATLVPVLSVCVLSIFFAAPMTYAAAAPLLILVGLGVILFAGASIRLHRQRMLSAAWIAMLIGTPVAVALGLFVAPWTVATDFTVLQPANAIGRSFTETFTRRTGAPLSIVAGDPRLAALVGLQPARPEVFLSDAPSRSPWVNADDIRKHGAVVLWLATDALGTPPAEIKRRFPDVTAETPRVFERRVDGRLAPLRIGWALIRPQNPNNGSR